MKRKINQSQGRVTLEQLSDYNNTGYLENPRIRAFQGRDFQSAGVIFRADGSSLHLLSRHHFEATRLRAVDASV